MSRLNLNSIVSWINSHIIDYPTVINLRILVSINMISFFLLLIISPILGILWLIVPSIYLLYHKKYKNIGIVWGFLFLSWYIVFTACMFGFDGPIWIGGDCTPWIFNYISYNTLYTRFLEGFCIQTVFFVDLLSFKLGFPIYIPSLFKGLLALIKFIFGGKGPAECCPNKKPEKSSFCETSWKDIFKSRSWGKITPVKVDSLDPCAEMRAAIEKNRGYFDLYNSKSNVKEDRYAYYFEAFASTKYKFTFCSSRYATSDEKKSNNKKP